MAWHGATFSGCRPFADGHSVLDLPEPVPFKAGMPGAADGAFRSQVLEQLFFQNASRLNEQAAIDRLVRHLLRCGRRTHQQGDATPIAWDVNVGSDSD